MCNTHSFLGRLDEAMCLYARARDQLRAGHYYVVAGAAAIWELQRVTLPYRTDDLSERCRLAAEAVEDWTRASDLRPPRFSPRLARVPLLLLEGGWAEIRDLVVDEPPADLVSRGRVIVGDLGQWWYATGDVEQAAALVRLLLPGGTATEPGNTYYFDALTAQRLAILLALDAGDLPGAKEWVEAHEHWLAWSDAVLGRADGHILRAMYERAAGDLDAAGHSAGRALDAASAPRQPRVELSAQRLLGELDTATERYSDAATHLAKALAPATACAAPYERALTLLALAELRVAEGDQDDARAALDEARAVFADLGAAPVLARANALAARLAG